MNRREFGTLLFGGVVATILLPTLPLLDTQTIPFGASDLGKELLKPLVPILPEGIYNVIIKEIKEKKSRLRENLNLVFVLQEEKTGNLLYKYINEDFLFPLVPILIKCGVNPKQQINLDDIVGKQIEVRVGITNFNKKQYNIIES